MKHFGYGSMIDKGRDHIAIYRQNNWWNKAKKATCSSRLLGGWSISRQGKEFSGERDDRGSEELSRETEKAVLLSRLDR